MRSQFLRIREQYCGARIVFPSQVQADPIACWQLPGHYMRLHQIALQPEVFGLSRARSRSYCFALLLNLLPKCLIFDQANFSKT